MTETYLNAAIEQGLAKVSLVPGTNAQKKSFEESAQLFNSTTNELAARNIELLALTK